MKRRDFLKLGLIFAPIPGAVLASPEQFTRAAMSAILDGLPTDGYKQEYFAFLHPSNWRDVRTYAARGRWQDAWRRYRTARRENVCGYLTPRAVLERFGYPAAPPFGSEIGKYEGFRIITS